MRRTILLAVALCVTLAAPAWSQELDQTQALSGILVYVSGSDLVVRLDDGTVKAYLAAPGATVAADGNEVTLRNAVPGQRLAGTLTTLAPPATVESVRTVKGRVWYVSPPGSVILTLPEGNAQYRVPEGQKFSVDGLEKTVWDLEKGMEITATVVQTAPRQETASGKQASGKAPPVATPEVQGALLFEELAEAAELLMPELPQTGGPLPFAGFLGLLLIGASAALRLIRA